MNPKGIVGGILVIVGGALALFFWQLEFFWFQGGPLGLALGGLGLFELWESQRAESGKPK